MKIMLRSSLVLLALLATVSTANAQTWTIEPVLKRLDANDNVLPSGQADVMRTDSLRIGVYFKLTKAASSTVAVEFHGISTANVHFTGLTTAQVSTVVASLPNRTLAAGASPAAETAPGFYRRWENTRVFTTALNRAIYRPFDSDQRWQLGFNDVDLNLEENARGIYCASASMLTCEVFFGVLVVPLSNLGSTVQGSLSMKVGGAMISDTITAHQRERSDRSLRGRQQHDQLLRLPHLGLSGDRRLRLERLQRNGRLHRRRDGDPVRDTHQRQHHSDRGEDDGHGRGHRSDHRLHAAFVRDHPGQPEKRDLPGHRRRQRRRQHRDRAAAGDADAGPGFRHPAEAGWSPVGRRRRRSPSPTTTSRMRPSPSARRATPRPRAGPRPRWP